ncbi:hypothetical protein [Crateriforma spongiae]|uniref:hypothetical protein n=1 Tax=Crateriforma spongiae TaxID=2724528 RepID=UPI0039AEEFBB
MTRIRNSSPWDYPQAIAALRFNPIAVRQPEPQELRMPRKPKADRTSHVEVPSTVELVDVFTVARQTTPAQDRQREKTRQRKIRIWKKGIEKMHAQANGTPIVRESIGMGKCTKAGLFIRETESFIFYAEGCFDATQVEHATVKRLKKDGLRGPHLEACPGCKDHPSQENSIF